MRDERTAKAVRYKDDPRASPNRLNQPCSPLAKRGPRPICLFQALRSGDGSLPKALPVGRAGIVYAGNQQDRLIELGLMGRAIPGPAAALGHLIQRLQVADTRHDPSSVRHKTQRERLISGGLIIGWSRRAYNSGDLQRAIEIL